MIFPGPDLTSAEPRPTALFSACASVSAANKWTAINGWSVSLVYTNVTEEYNALTRRAAVADFGMLWRYIVRGPDAPDYLARVTSAPLRNLELGESARGLMLTSVGTVVDLIDVARLGDDLYLLTCSRAHPRRLQLAARGFDATIEDITGRVAALAIIGPDAHDVAAVAGLKVDSENLAAQATVRGVETAARPINVGVQPGVEIIYPYEEALTLWERVRRAAAPTPCGLDALEVLRIEAGAPRLGVDFIGADESEEASETERSPQALGLPHLAPVNRAWFNGRRSLSSASEPIEKVLTVLALDSDELNVGSAVFANGEPIGHITSAAFSPRLKRAIAFAEISQVATNMAYEVGPLGNLGKRVSAKVFDTAESELSQAFQASLREATESRR